jgi:hypothetical protein
MNTTYWNSKDYLSFVLLHMAFADNELSMAELYHMASRLGPDRVVSMRAYIEQLSKKEQLKIIKKSRDKFYPGAFGKSSLISEIQELCQADGEFSKLERDVLERLENIM